MGEAPSSPRRRRRGPQARLYGVFVRHGGSAPRDNAVEAVVRGDWPYRVSSDFEHVADLTLAARGGLTARLGAFELSLADVREHGAEMLILDDRSL